MSNKRVNKAYVRYDGSGRVIPGSLILNRFKPKVGNWSETPAYLCCNPLPPDPRFISTWRTIGPDEAVSLLYVPDGTYSGTIDWGDGTITDNSLATCQHTYAEPGDYVITVTGTIIGFAALITDYFDSAAKIISVSQWGNLKVGDGTGNGFGAFGECANLDLSTVTDILDLTGATTMDQFFSGATGITTINRINEWDVSTVTNMNYTFGFSNFNSDISSWDVSSVTTMDGMFSNSDFNQDISGWNVSNVINMNNIFANASTFNQNIGAWDVNSVNGMNNTFSGASVFNQDISSWNVGSVTNMTGMFENAITFNQNLSTWCVDLIPSEPMFFATGAAAWVLPKPVWGTCP